MIGDAIQSDTLIALVSQHEWCVGRVRIKANGACPAAWRAEGAFDTGALSA